MAEAAAAAREAVALTDSLLFREACYINGEWVAPVGGATIPVNNPATGAIVGSVPRLGAAETRRAIEAAERAWPAWRAKTAKQRATVLRTWYDLMIAHRDDL